MHMAYRVFAALAAVDVISPILSVVGNALNGPSYNFLVPYDCGWSGREVISLLKRHGIKSWGHMVVSNTLMLSVRLDQAEWTQHVLDRSGIPVENRACAPSTPAPGQASYSDSGDGLDSGIGGALKKLWNLDLF